MSLLASIQSGAAAALEAHEFFSADPEIPVITEQLRDFENRIETAVAKMDPGICVVIVTATGEVGSPNVQGPELSSISVVARVVEHPKINKTRQPAAHVAEAVAAILHRKKIGDATAGFSCVGIAIADDPTYLSYDVTFRCAGIIGDPERIPST